MKRGFSILLCLGAFALGTLASGQCPEDPNDRGQCDTMYVEAWPEDTVLQGGGPYFVRVPIYVTSDVADSWDSIAAFVIPLCFASTNPAANAIIDPYYNYCGAGDLHPYPDLDRSIFRHLPSMEDPQVRNWMMDLSAEYLEWSTRILDLNTPNNFRLALVAAGNQDHRFDGGSRVLLATITFTLQDSSTICLDTCFWPPTNRLTWVTKPVGGGLAIKKIPRPGTPDPYSFRTCINFGLPDILHCDRSYSDPCLVACPIGDISFRVYLRDANGSPVAGYSNVFLDFSDCTGIIPCSAEASWPIVYPDAPSDANGVMTFQVQAGGCEEVHQAQIKARCGLIGYVPVKTVDTDGNHAVTISDWHHVGVDPCNDYNCNDEVNFWDLEFFRQHIGHTCDLDPCLLVSQDLTVTPDTLLPEDSIHIVQLFIQNNYTEPCTAQFVKFFRGGFGQGPALVLFETRYLWEELLTGEVAVAEADFVVPEYLPGHIVTKLYTSCCEDSLAAIFDFTVRMCPPASMVYQFPIVMDFVPAYVETLDYVSEEEGWSWFTSTVGDTLWINIVTPATSVLGVTGGVALYFFDYDWNLLAYRTCEVRLNLNSGDVTSDCVVNVGDVVYLINYLYRNGDAPDPLRAGNLNCDCTLIGNELFPLLDVADVVYMVNYLYRGGPPPVPSEECQCGYKGWFPH
ncbi:MAG: hypothetical protein WBF13_12170 [Candidatus Zixiibacteriota bacterium]